MVVVIGERWVGVDSHGQARLSDPADMVAHELRMGRRGADRWRLIGVVAPPVRVPPGRPPQRNARWIPVLVAAVIVGLVVAGVVAGGRAIIDWVSPSSAPSGANPSPGSVESVGTWKGEGTIHGVAVTVTRVTRQGDRLVLQLLLNNRSSGDFSFKFWGECSGTDNLGNLFACSKFSDDWTRTVEAGSRGKMEIALDGTAESKTRSLKLTFVGGPDLNTLDKAKVTVPVPRAK